MSQKGGIVLIVLILVVLGGLLLGTYLVSQNTNFFSKAGSAQITIPYDSPSTPKATPQKSASPSAEYDNPFEAKPAYENPFEEAYQNPIETL